MPLTQRPHNSMAAHAEQSANFSMIVIYGQPSRFAALAFRGLGSATDCAEATLRLGCAVVLVDRNSMAVTEGLRVGSIGPLVGLIVFAAITPEALFAWLSGFGGGV